MWTEVDELGYLAGDMHGEWEKPRWAKIIDKEKEMVNARIPFDTPKKWQNTRNPGKNYEK